MIELTTTTAAMLYLSLTLSVLFGLWGYNHYQNRKQKIITLSQELLVCEFCHGVYMADVSKNVTQCPDCQCFNKHNTFKKNF
jgi:hypothetical protein